MSTESKNPRVVAIVQARMGSTRLPGKVLADIEGHPMLWHVLHRIRQARAMDDVVVATTMEPADDAIVAFCAENDVRCFRGSKTDVLDRYYHAARRYQAGVIVRITSDCPLIDPEIVDKTVRAFLAKEVDYASNVVVRTYPRGLDTEVMSFAALQATWSEAPQPYQRAHVTPYLYETPGRFTILSVTGEEDNSAYRWTVDASADLEFVREVYARFKNETFSLDDVLQLMEREPRLPQINSSVVQKALQEG